MQTCPERFGLANESGSNHPRAISLHVVRGLQTWNYWHLHSMHDRGLLILYCEKVLIRGGRRVGYRGMISVVHSWKRLCLAGN